MQVLVQNKLNTVMNAFVAGCKELFGDKLSDVRLFGSYARGDYAGDSDIDIMVILDMNEDDVRKSLSSVCRIASDIDLEYNTHIIPILQNMREYELHKETYGFFRNVEREGVSHYAQQ